MNTDSHLKSLFGLGSSSGQSSNTTQAKKPMSAQVTPLMSPAARIKVVGIGGGGGNAINRMIQAQIEGVEFISLNTDAQALYYNEAPTKVNIGKATTGGLGAGASPEVGRKAAEESSEEIRSKLEGADMVFITYGLGGGSGTGGGPLVAEIARELGALTVAVVTKPFSFEGATRRKQAQDGLQELSEKVDSLIVIPNDRLLNQIDKKMPLTEAFTVVDDVLRQGIQGVAELITVHGLINVDFADVKSVMKNSGPALMGIGFATGENRASEAAKAAINSPLLELSIEGAKGILMNITGGNDLSMFEVDEAARVVTAMADPEANIIFGAVVNDNYTGEVKVTVVATGFSQEKLTALEEAGTTSGAWGGVQRLGGSTGSGDKVMPKQEDDLEVPAFLRRSLEKK